MRFAVPAACAWAFLCAGQAQLPPPFATPSASNPPRVISQPNGARLQVPPGFEVSVFAEGFQVPRYMVLGPGQEVLLTDSARSGSVVALKGGQRKTVLSGLDRPYGMALWNGYLYVAETTEVKRYRYDAAALSATGGERIVHMPEAAGGHWTRVILFDRAGKKFYLGVGSHSNNSAGEPELRAAISRFNPGRQRPRDLRLGNPEPD